MPRNTWFKKLWDWKFKGKKLERKKRMRSFKMKKVKCNTSDIKIRCYDYSGRDLTPYLKSSFVFNGIPGGFYLDTSER
jgi:hypothetical protein